MAWDKTSLGRARATSRVRAVGESQELKDFSILDHFELLSSLRCHSHVPAVAWEGPRKGLGAGAHF